MKISYTWLKDYINTDLSAEEIGVLLTDGGLEVESIEEVESIKGGLKGLVIGEVLTKEKHPDADKLSVTTVSIGSGEPLNIVCGAPNVAAGQKVVVATIGTKLYGEGDEWFEIKKSKIRGAVSEGMLCAEDEIGLGKSHDGIIILDAKAVVGTPVAEYYKVSNDYVFEIGITPNRSDALSHLGVARDLAALIQINRGVETNLIIPVSPDSMYVTNERKIKVNVQDTTLCPRYSGIVLDNVKVTESPDWLKNRLKAIGLRPINNIVDITNYVLHETGQPLHAFDYDKISGATVNVRQADRGSLFTTLDGTDRKLEGTELMICNEKEPMCIAGVFGGLESGVTETTTTLFLESAFFNAVSVRKTSKLHGLKTDSSFRFERGTDPNATVFALMRAAYLISDIAGGRAASQVIDVYPDPVENTEIPLSLINVDKLIGKSIDRATIKTILEKLGIVIKKESGEALLISVPPFKVDVTREADVVEEILRVYGYNNIEIPDKLNASISHRPKADREKLTERISDLLAANGFNEMMALSLNAEQLYTQEELFTKDSLVGVLNPLSNELNVLRQSLLFGGLQTLAFNINRKQQNLKFFEFGKTYFKNGDKYQEENHLAILATGLKNQEGWNTGKGTTDFYFLKSTVSAVLQASGVDFQKLKYQTVNNILIEQGMELVYNNTVIGIMGIVAKGTLKKFDVSQVVVFADINTDALLKAFAKNKIQYSEVIKYPQVRRDLALIIDKAITYAELERIAYDTERKLLKQVNIFDVYEGDKLPEGKKSYALSFILQHNDSTLTDQQIDKIMEKMIANFNAKTGAELRK